MTHKKMMAQDNIVAAPQLVEVEWVLDYRGGKPVCRGEGLDLRRVKIRFLRQATRFCPSVYHWLNPHRREPDSAMEPVRQHEGNHGC
jgi:hypothetical protein